jgi:uncharacterized membrane protein YeaQ/YmgE (transglycosylase-associated protein family)
MPEMELSQQAQHWVNVVLIWVGFGALAGLLAKALLPVREPSGALSVLLLGIVGSMAGLLVLSLLPFGSELHPISPVGFLAAASGAFLLLIGYQPVCAWFRRREEAEADENAGNTHHLG